MADHTTSHMPDGADNWRWRKYGTKTLRKAKPQHVRDYYKCSKAGCPARKYVDGDSMKASFKVSYHGVHDHQSARAIAAPRATSTPPLATPPLVSSPSMGVTKCHPLLHLQIASQLASLYTMGMGMNTLPPEPYVRDTPALLPQAQTLKREREREIDSATICSKRQAVHNETHRAWQRLGSIESLLVSADCEEPLVDRSPSRESRPSTSSSSKSSEGDELSSADYKPEVSYPAFIANQAEILPRMPPLCDIKLQGLMQQFPQLSQSAAPTKRLNAA